MRTGNAVHGGKCWEVVSSSGQITELHVSFAKDRKSPFQKLWREMTENCASLDFKFRPFLLFIEYLILISGKSEVTEDADVCELFAVAVRGQGEEKRPL